MNACEMVYDPCKSVLQMVQMLENAFKNTLANLTNVLRMKQEHDAWVTNLHNTHCGCFSLSFICQQPVSVQTAYFPSNLYSLSTFVLHSMEMSITNASESLQMSYDHYKCLANNKNGLRLITNMLRMVTNMLQICFPTKF